MNPYPVECVYGAIIFFGLFYFAVAVGTAGARGRNQMDNAMAKEIQAAMEREQARKK